MEKEKRPAIRSKAYQVRRASQIAPAEAKKLLLKAIEAIPEKELKNFLGAQIITIM